MSKGFKAHLVLHLVLIMTTLGVVVPRVRTEQAPSSGAPAVSVAIVEGGRVVWAQGFGVKEAGGTSPVTATTVFQAGSNSKAVTVSAVLRVVQAGRLSLDANVSLLGSHHRRRILHSSD